MPIIITLECTGYIAHIALKFIHYGVMTHVYILTHTVFMCLNGYYHKTNALGESRRALVFSRWKLVNLVGN